MSEEKKNRQIKEFIEKEKANHKMVGYILEDSYNGFINSANSFSKEIHKSELNAQLRILRYTDYISKEEYEIFFDELYEKKSILNKLHSNQEKVKNNEQKGEERSVNREELQK